MVLRSKLPIVLVILLSALIPGPSLYAGSLEASKADKTPVFVAMPGPGENVPLGNGKYLIYGFVKTPKMGPAIMKIQVFDKNGERDRSVTITADSGMPDMPSMGTDHATCMLNKKGDYLVPINITMPGDWEVRLTVSQDGTVVYRGSYRFNV